MRNFPQWIICSFPSPTSFSSVDALLRSDVTFGTFRPPGSRPMSRDGIDAWKTSWSLISGLNGSANQNEGQTPTETSIDSGCKPGGERIAIGIYFLFFSLFWLHLKKIFFVLFLQVISFLSFNAGESFCFISSSVLFSFFKSFFFWKFYDWKAFFFLLFLISSSFPFFRFAPFGDGGRIRNI